MDIVVKALARSDISNVFHISDELSRREHVSYNERKFAMSTFERNYHGLDSKKGSRILKQLAYTKDGNHGESRSRQHRARSQ
jgi:hypothetical protein